MQGYVFTNFNATIKYKQHIFQRTSTMKHKSINMLHFVLSVCSSLAIMLATEIFDKEFKCKKFTDAQAV